MKASEIVKELILVLLILIVAGESFAQSGWVRLNMPLKNYIHVTFLNPSTGFIVTQDNIIYKTSNSGSTWSVFLSNQGLTLPSKRADILNEQNILLMGGSMYFTSDGGANWISSYIPTGCSGSGFTILQCIDIVSPSTAFVGGTDVCVNESVDGIVYKTTNAGLNWFQSFRGDFEHYDLKAKDSLNIAKSSGAFMRSSDGGVSWNYVSNMHAFGGIMSDPFRDTIMVSDTRGLVIRSTNRGNEFIELQTGNTKPLRNLFFIDRKRGHFIGDSGVILFTSNAGETFSVQQSNTMQKLNSVYFINKDTGFAVGDSGVVLRTYTGGILTGIEINNSVSNPTKFALLQNYPNPFNPSTTIRFDVRTSGNVSLKVYDVLGREVAVLADEYLRAGSYERVFDASDLSSGVYFYTLRVTGMAGSAQSDFQQTLRMVVLK